MLEDTEDEGRGPLARANMIPMITPIMMSFKPPGVN
jgi:hypothetical protein